MHRPLVVEVSKPHLKPFSLMILTVVKQTRAMVYRLNRIYESKAKKKERKKKKERWVEIKREILK